ncbi:hypothetical protein EJ07DRAFT_45190, partial [Lizonia empirigonia]
MDPIQEAIEYLESRERRDKFPYREVAKICNVNRTTLSRRHQGKQRLGATYYIDKQLLNPQREHELLVRYITKLTKQGLPPTREMIRNPSSEVARQQLSESWVTRFINRHEIHLISKWTTAMDRTRHLADSESK